MNSAIHALRVNVKSLAAESRYIRQEISRAKDLEAKSRLACHRAWRVKPESRLAQLALAFVRGREYRTVELKCREPVDPGALSKKLRRFVPSVEDGAVRAWLS
jgi:hypothetical protein